jgi:ubiquinone/menaquinone biosynthesis C-methylase UbiE
MTADDGDGVNSPGDAADAPDDVAAAYDELAPDYADDLESSPYHEHLARPGTTALVPAVEGSRILDAGCGRGQFAAWLADNGAEVVGVDASEEMLAEARERLATGDGDAVTLQRTDLAEPLPFDDDTFDGIVSGLVLSYVEDWDALFAEFARVLRPGGFVVFSVGHPADEFPLADDESYFETRRKVKEWAVDVPYYARPLSAMVTPVIDAGFRLEELAEPEPTEGFREQWPERYEKESRYPVFVAFRCHLSAE